MDEGKDGGEGHKVGYTTCLCKATHAPALQSVAFG